MLSSSLMIFEEIPPDFTPAVSVSSCYVAVGKKLLFLRRVSKNEVSSLWAPPAGKVEVGETPMACLRRELQEECGLIIKEGVIEYGTLYCRLPHVDYSLYLFEYRLPDYPVITLNEEHDAIAWVEPDAAFSLSLMPQAEAAFRIFLQRRNPLRQS